MHVNSNSVFMFRTMKRFDWGMLNGFWVVLNKIRVRVFTGTMREEERKIEKKEKRCKEMSQTGPNLFI